MSPEELALRAAFMAGWEVCWTRTRTTEGVSRTREQEFAAWLGERMSRPVHHTHCILFGKPGGRHAEGYDCDGRINAGFPKCAEAKKE